MTGSQDLKFVAKGIESQKYYFGVYLSCCFAVFLVWLLFVPMYCRTGTKTKTFHTRDEKFPHQRQKISTPKTNYFHTGLVSMCLVEPKQLLQYRSLLAFRGKTLVSWCEGGKFKWINYRRGDEGLYECHINSNPIKILTVKLTLTGQVKMLTVKVTITGQVKMLTVKLTVQVKILSAHTYRSG